jgi:signal transduction histidine kinase
MAATLRTSLLALLLVSSLVPIAGLGWLEYRALAEAREEQRHAQLQQAVLAAALRADAAAAEGRDPLLAAADGAPADDVILLGEDGVMRSARGAALSGLGEIAGETLSGEGEVQDQLVVWARAPTARAIVFLVDDHVHTIPAPQLPFLLLTAFIASGVAVVLAFVMLRVLRPVAHLEAASRRLARGEWGERVPVEGPAEVRALGEAFNEMAGALERQRSDLDSALGERTRALIDREGDLEALRFTLAHEFREPLRSLRWMADDLLERPLDADAREAARVLRRRIDSLDAVFRDLLRYEEVSRRPAAVERVALDTVLSRALDAVSVPLRVQREPLPEIEGDAELLREAFAEVLRNAATHGGGRVDVQAEREGDEVLLRFDDRGPGIPAARREDALNLFQRLRRDVPGTGAGLAIARRAIERHGGTLALDEAPGGGARVVVRLPQQAQLDAPPAREAPRRRF